MILQFGTSRFLQAHVALFAHQASESGQLVPPIIVVKTTPGERRATRLGGFSDPRGYCVILRGLQNGTTIDQAIQVKSVIAGWSVHHDWDALVALATGALSHIVSNTGDEGYVVKPGERVALPATASPNGYPAILLALLHARWSAGGSGITILPCELVQRNGSVLHAIVAELANTNRCAPAFIDWLGTRCMWVNTLVDRIVSEELEPVGAIAEPYALWAIEDQPGLTLPFAHRAMIVTGELDRFERLKLHILNLGHTWLAERWWQEGAVPGATVRESLADPATYAAFDALFSNEVIPGFAKHGMGDEARAYLARTVERLANPFLDHQVADIHSGHAIKVAKRITAFIRWVDTASGNHNRLPLATLRDLARRRAE